MRQPIAVPLSKHYDCTSWWMDAHKKMKTKERMSGWIEWWMKDIQAGITDGKEGESGGDFAPMVVRLITGAVRISTHLLSDELPSGSLQEEQKPLIRLFSTRPQRPQVSFTPWDPVLWPVFEKWIQEEAKLHAHSGKVGGWPQLFGNWLKTRRKLPQKVTTEQPRRKMEESWFHAEMSNRLKSDFSGASWSWRLI